MLSRFLSSARTRCARFSRSVPVLCLGLLSAACARNENENRWAFNGDASFGTQAPDIDSGDASEGVSGGDPDAPGSSERVRLQLFHGALNLASVRFCHDPDFRADDPYTVTDEGDRGALPGRPLTLEGLDGGVLDGGGFPLGVAAGYFVVERASEGALTVHRAPLPADAGSDAGRDGGASPTSEGGAASDAGAGSSTDGGGAAATDPCDPATLEAVLPFPLTANWLEPPRQSYDAGAMDGGPSDAGPSDPMLDAQPTPPERRGFAKTLSGDAPLTLFGSGRSLDAKELAQRVARAREEYLARHPGETQQAEAAGRAYGAWLESTFGPRFLLARGGTPGSRTFALSFVHLIPDIPPARSGEVGSGPLHVCMTIDTTESEPPDGGSPRSEFRNISSLGGLFDPGAAYRFKLFVEADFVATQATCARTSLKPVAELGVLPNRFKQQKSYLLVAWGARSPSDLCTTAPSDSVVKPGCALGVEALNARMEILESALPSESEDEP